MVRIRLRRTGKAKQPSYRVVVADSRSPRDGRFIEIIGHYNPVQQPKVLNIQGDRARYWLGVGASPSDTVTYLFKKVGILDEQGKVLPESAYIPPVAEETDQPASGDTAPAPAPNTAAPAPAPEAEAVPEAEAETETVV